MTTRICRVTAAAALALASSCGTTKQSPPAEVPHTQAAAPANTATANTALSETPAPALVSSRSSTPRGAERATKLTLSAKVVDVDKAQRLLTVRDRNGETQTIRVGDRARNFDRVKQGDDVVVTYYESTAFNVVSPGEAQLGVSEVSGAARAAQGSQPGADAARVTTVVADIAKLDRDKQEAVLRGQDGRTITVHVADPSNFDKVQVGDRIQLTLTEALAIDVEPASAQ